MSLKTREVQVKAMKKYDELGQWHTMEGDTPEQAVQKLAENGVISPKPTKRRKPRKRPEQPAEIQTNQTNAIPDTFPGAENFSNAAFDAKRFLESFGTLTFIYYRQSWYRFTVRGWKEILEEELDHEIIRYIVQNRFKLETAEISKIRLALTFFCQIDTLDEPFENTYFLRFKNGRMETEHAPGWIRCENGVFHIQSIARKLARKEKIEPEDVREPTPELFTQGKIPCNFSPNAQCKNWWRFLEMACPEDAKTLQQAFGLSLTYDRSYNVFFVVHGPAGSGKSTALNVLQRLNAGSVSQVSLGHFGERFLIYPMTINRVNIVQDMDSIFETDGSVSLREAVLKSITAGESIEVERKHKETQRDYLRALCVFGTNRLPRFADKSNAIQHRMKVIEFPNVFRGTEGQVLNLHEILIQELEGIFIWALKGYGELLESGAVTVWESERSADAKVEAFKETRPEILFCEEMLVRDDFSGYVSTLEIYKAYEKYCYERGFRAAGMGRVLPLITDHMGIERSKLVRMGGKPFRAVKGIRPLTDVDEF